MGMMWEPRLVVVQDAGTSNGIDCGNVQAFEEAVWHKLTASKAAHRERWQAITNEVRQLEQECKDLQELKRYLARKEDNRVCQACTAHGANAVVCWSNVSCEDMLVDNAVCRGLKVQRELDADVFLRCVRDKHHRFVHMLHRRRNDGAETMEALALQTHGVCMRQSNALTLSEPKKYMDTLIQQHRAKMQERQTLCAQMKKRNQQYFKLVNEEDNKRQPGLDQHKAHWINHQCCHQHCNAEYMQTETSTGEFRMVARATRRIQMGEEIFANYNNIGDETNAFSMPNCMCCSCRDKSKNP